MYTSICRRRLLSQTINCQIKCSRKYSKFNESTNNTDYYKQLCQLGPEDLDSTLGPKRIRKTKTEATMHMLADHLRVFGEIDKELMDLQLNRSFGEDDTSNSNINDSSHSKSQPSSSSSLIKVDAEKLDLLQTKDVQNLQDELYLRYNNMPDTKKFKDWENVSIFTASKPQSNSQKHLFSTLQEIDSKGLDTIAEELKSLDNHKKVTRHTFHFLIRKLLKMRYTKPAQAALNCLLLSDLKLSPESLLLALTLARANGDIKRFIQLTRVFPSLCDVKNKMDDIMSSYEMGGWYDKSGIDTKLYERFFHNYSNQQLQNTLGPSFGVLAMGMYKFRWYDEIDRVLTAMRLLDIKFDAIVLTANLLTAVKTKDNLRFNWTIKQVEQLPSAIKNNERLKSTSIYASQQLNPQRQSYIEQLFWNS